MSGELSVESEELEVRSEEWIWIVLVPSPKAIPQLHTSPSTLFHAFHQNLTIRSQFLEIHRLD